MRTRLGLLAAVVLPVALAGQPLPAAVAAAASERRIDYQQWASTAALDRGTARGVVITEGELRLGRATRSTGGYSYGTWTSPWATPGFQLTELVPSWGGSTPGDSQVRIEVRGRTGASTGSTGSWNASSWDTVARWALDDRQLRRTSLDSQSDDMGRMAYDTWLTSGGAGVAQWQLRVTLLRRTGGTSAPTVTSVGAMASRLPAVSAVRTSSPGSAADQALGTMLPVPRYSQMVHTGEYPQYDGGGEAWCSPTSTAMVLGYYDALPRPSAYDWVNPAYADPVVDHVARMTYDTHLGGTGNWSFSTAYAAARTGHGFVTRLRSLRGAQRFIAAGIPVVASVSFGAGRLDGAPIGSTGGHLLVIVGFLADGDVVVNDPAAATRRGVRRTYDRGQFEDAWLKRYPAGGSMHGSGGLVYVIRDDAHPLPPRRGTTNW